MILKRYLVIIFVQPIRVDRLPHNILQENHGVAQMFENHSVHSKRTDPKGLKPRCCESNTVQYIFP